MATAVAEMPDLHTIEADDLEPIASGPEDAAGAKEFSPNRRRRELCFVGCTVFLVFVAVLGPVYAFLIVSCVSTRSCDSGTVLAQLEASCAEGPELQEEMVHGDTCTVRCPSFGTIPTVSELRCEDGTLKGADQLRCALDTTTRAPGTGVTGLVSGAIIGGDPGRACVEASNLGCDAAPGDSGVLVVLYGLTQEQCDAVLLDCKSRNDNFLYVQHTGETSADWTCVFGCRTPLLTQAPQTTAAGAATTTRSVALNTPSLQDRGCTRELSGPTCVHMRGSCNPLDDGDYYRSDSCVAGSPQWMKADGSRRIRKDPVVQLSLGGRWLLEADFDPESDNYGATFIARQPSFAEELPEFGEKVWNFQCRVQSGIDNTIVYEPLLIDLGDCTCTSEGDCSGQGMAVGSKDLGPNCQCICDTGFQGEKCETKFCEAPEIFGAYLPACQEGQFIAPGARCTPNCEPTRTASENFLTCVTGVNSSLTALSPPVFECALINSLLEQDVFDYFTEAPPATTGPPCTNFDCSYHGLATGTRENGVCKCICDAGFIGSSCETREGNCLAPVFGSIENSATSPCAEGVNISVEGLCNARCAAGFYPIPAVLACYGPNRPLVPGSFTCFSSLPLEEEWCTIAQYMAITSSVIAVLLLLLGCFLRSKPVVNKFQGTFYITGTLVEHRELGKLEVAGDHGIIHIVRPGAGLNVESSLPPRLQKKHLVVKSQDDEETGSKQDDMVLKDFSPPPTADGPPRTADTFQTSSSCKQAVTSGALGAGGPQTGESFFSTGSAVKRARLHDSALADEEKALPGVPISLRDTASDWGVDREEFGEDFGEVSPPPDEATTAWAATERSLREAPLAPGEFTGGVGSPSSTEYALPWLVHKQVLEAESNARRAEQDVKAENRRRHFEFQAAADVAERLQATEEARSQAEADIVSAFGEADGEALRTAVESAKALLAKVSDAPRATTMSLDRLVHLANARLLQFDTKTTRAAQRQRYEDRVHCGDAADWRMTQEELWEYVEQLEVGRVKAGLKAHLLVSSRRAQDDARLTMMHLACQQLSRDIDNTEHRSRAIEVMRALIEARANPSPADAEANTPLDLLLKGGGLKLPIDESDQPHPALAAVMELGLRPSEGAAELARQEQQLRKEMQAKRKSSLVSPRSSIIGPGGYSPRNSGSRNSSPRNSPRNSSRGEGRPVLASGSLLRPSTVDHASEQQKRGSRGSVGLPSRPSTTSNVPASRPGGEVPPRDVEGRSSLASRTSVARPSSPSVGRSSVSG